MAELVAGAFLRSSFQVIIEKLASVDIRDYFNNNKLDELVKDLCITLYSINYVLEEAEIKQYQNKHVKKWLDELKHVVYDADQVLDEIATDAMLNKMKAEDEPITATVLGYFPALITNPYESRINEILKTLEFLAKQKKELRLGKGPSVSKEGLVSWKPSKRLSSLTLVDESRIYGRDVDKTKLIKFLLENNSSGDQVPIISIVGLGGMGKTTLAKLVYNDNKIEEHFDLKAWVYVSESFDVVGLTKAILKSFNPSADGEYLELLQHQLQHMLMGKKYLLVLDNIRNENAKYWELLLLPFNHGSSGGKILVTTREKEVAHNVLKSTQLFDLQQLDKSNCWRLFVTHAFQGKNVCEYPMLESIGRIIVDKCRGLPFGIKSLGQHLQINFSQNEWMKTLENDMWHLLEDYVRASDTTAIKFQRVEADVRLNIEDYEVSQISESAADVSQVMFEAETIWRLVGLMSSVVGLLCYALSPSFNRLIGRWKPFKFFLYGVLSLAIFTAILVAKKSSHSTRHVQLKTYINFAFFMIISVYSLFYDKAVDGKPEVLSIVSNAAFALVSLSLHKLINIGFEIGVFSYFLGCFTVQLLTINWMLIFVAIFFGCPLYVMHMNSQPEVASGGKVIPSSSHA